VDFNTPLPEATRDYPGSPYVLPPLLSTDPDLHGSHVCLRCRIIYLRGMLSAEHLHTTTRIPRRGKSGDFNVDAEPPAFVRS